MRPHHQVVVSGPSLSVDYDPSPIQLCMSVKKAQKGKVILVDLQLLNQKLRDRYARRLIRHAGKTGTVEAARLYQRDMDLRRFPKSTSIYGGVDFYKKTLRERLRNLNPRFLAETRIQAWPADILDTGMADETIDVIVDQGTHDFAIRSTLNPGPVNTNEKKANLRRLVNEYHRILKPGGKAVLFFQPDEDNPYATKMRERLARTFGKRGMDVQHVELNDEPYRFRSNPVRSMYKYPVALVVTKTRSLEK